MVSSVQITVDLSKTDQFIQDCENNRDFAIYTTHSVRKPNFYTLTASI